MAERCGTLLGLGRDRIHLKRLKAGQHLRLTGLWRPNNRRNAIQCRRLGKSPSRFPFYFAEDLLYTALNGLSSEKRGFTLCIFLLKEKIRRKIREKMRENEKWGILSGNWKASSVYLDQKSNRPLRIKIYYQGSGVTCEFMPTLIL